ncbi:uncharacterized protein LOC117930941 isoform X2 [Vitis riparia]|uniref:uncharacterized protein LOC117930941 isoform X2 n=1 Tax=Vitis riparia TaxID=96939 RepID=UPI00155AC633|nr:uncharacterized protein LOC117930941 isoform X2 [Vitis riparia]
MADIVISVVAKVAEYLVAPIGRQLGYLYNYRINLDKLEEQVEKLGDARGRLQRDVEEADRQGDEIEPDVQKWLTRAEGIIQKAEELIKAEKTANTSCFNLKLRYQRSRQAKKQSGDIGKIQEECKFDRVAYCLTPQGAWSARLRDCKALESRESTLKEIMKALRNDDIRMIGVWGMGGVGKTTLANQVAEKAEEDKLFEKVVMALNVTRVPNVTKIQGEIASMLGLEFKEKEESGRAARLSKSLQKKETVLVILDDIWEELSLENIGIPYGDAHRGCKVLLTSREHAVLSKDMRTQKNFHIQHLCEQEAWSLFKNTAGNSVEELELRPIALEVVKECEGLPVAIVTIAKALTGESVAVWKTALEELKRSAPTNIRGVSKNVYSCLELSYNHLKGDEVKRLFLLCGMLCYGDISLDQLLKYGMGLDLFERVSSLEQIRNKLVTLVKILKDSSLLLDAEDRYRPGVGPGVFFGNNDENKFVRMHDVVGDVARAIAAKDPHRFVVIKEALGLEELQRKEEFRNCSRISLNCKDLHELPERLVCPRLEFFVLNSDAESSRIPDTFFEGTELLKVLDLSATYRTPLPSSLGFLSNLRTLRVYRCTFQDIAVIGELKKLQVLSFASCEIKRLPKEFMQLTDLRALDLWDCSHLEVIPQNVISSLSRLEHLCLAKSFTKWGAEGFGSGESNNACLSELNNLFYLKTLCIEITDPDLLSKDLVFEKLSRYVISVSVVPRRVDYNRSARTLNLRRVNKPCLVDCFSKLFKTVEDLNLYDWKDNHVLYEFDTDDFLQLKRLDIADCPGIQYIVDSTKGVPSHSAFPILEELRLFELENMDAVCYGPIPEGSFGKLRSLRVYDCKRLKSFISLPMEQGRDGSVLPEMGSLFSTRDFKTVDDFLQLKRLDIINCPGIQYIVDSTKGVPSHSALPILEELEIHGLENMDAVCYGPIPEGSFGKLRFLRVDRCERLKSFISLPMEQGRDGSVLPEMGSLFSTRDFKTVDDFLQLKRLDITNCPGIQYIVNPMKGVPSRSAFPILEELRLFELENMDAVCYGPIPEGSFGKLRSLRVYDCKRLKSFISLPMEQGRDGSVLPEMGSLDSTRDSKTVEDLELRRFGDTKHVLFELDTVDFLQLKHLVIGNCPGIQYIVDSTKGVPSHSALPILEELFISGLQNMDAVCYGPIPEGSFGKLRSLTVDRCERLKSFISLPMEQGRDGSVLPEMGSLFSTRDFKIVDDFLQLKRLDIINCPGIQYIVDSTKGVPSHSALPILEELEIHGLENMDAVCYGPIPEGSFGKLRFLRVDRCERLKSFISLPMEQGRDGSVLPEMGSLFSTRDFKIVDDFLQLKCLDIINCPGIQYIVDSTKGVPSHSALPILEELEIHGLENMDAVCYGPIPEGSFGKLRSLRVDGCERLKSFISLPMEQGRDGSVLREMGSLDSTRDFSSTGSSATQELSRSDVPTPFFNEQVTLPSLEKLKMYNLDNVIAIWHNQLPLESCCKLTSLEISKCNKLLNVFPSNILKGLQSLEYVTIDDCDSIEEIFDLQGVNCKEIHDIATIPLEELTLESLNSLKSVWNKDPQGLVSFQNLLVLKVVECPCLKYLFPITVAEGLVQLEELQIINCGVEEIVANENGDEVMSSLFPELTSLTLSGLDKLKGFYRGTRIARGPHLKKLIMLAWDQVGTLFQEIDSEGYIDSPIQQSFFLLEKDAFLHLEQLILEGPKMKIWQGQFSGESFCKLRLLKIRKCHDIFVVIPSNVLPKLYNLEELHVSKCNSVKEVFELVDKEYQVETLPRLTEMFLEDLPLLTYLSGLGQILKNLHSIEVCGCGNLIYLVTSSMAKTLVQLKVLTIGKCESVEEIVRHEGGEEPYDIVFSKLQSPKYTKGKGSKNGQSCGKAFFGV